MSQEWCPFAQRVGGPAWKVGYSHQGEQSPKRGIVPHSAEGYLPGLLAALHGPKTKSWQFTITYDELLQHYPVSANCWHAGDVDDDGGVAANIDLVGIEHLGLGAGEPLTQFQWKMLAQLYTWLREEHGFGPYIRRETVFEHSWVSDVYTACPSGRIPHLAIRTLLEEYHMPTEEYEELRKAIDSTNRLIELGFGAFRDGIVKVPIWPVGEVELRTIRHRGYYAPKQVEKLRMAVEGALLALQNHVTLHNTTGGAIDRTSGEFLDTMAVLLRELDGMLN